MSAEFRVYKKAVDKYTYLGKLSAPRRFRLTSKWYHDEGREAFIKAFKRETHIEVSSTRTQRGIIDDGIPRTPRDLEKKLRRPSFYKAHAQWCLQEIDRILNADNRFKGRRVGPYYAVLNQVLKTYLLDSILLFEEWGAYCAGVPGTFGIWKNAIENQLTLYHAAWQARFGNWSPLSFTLNHTDADVLLLRMNIELRLRFGFGVLGKINKATKVFEPLFVSQLLKAIAAHKTEVELAIPFPHIERIYQWANMYVHGGIKLYSWAGPATLDYLRPFLIGGQYDTNLGRRGFNINLGIKASKETVLRIQEAAMKGVDKARFELIALPPQKCQLFLKD